MNFYKTLQLYQLNKAEQQELYWRWKLYGCQESRNKLILSFMPMVLTIATQLSKRTGIEPLEYFQQAFLIISEALTKYKPNKANLSTFIYNTVRWKLLDYAQTLLSPVKYSARARRKFKKLNIPISSPIYLSEFQKYFKKQEDENEVEL